MPKSLSCQKEHDKCLLHVSKTNGDKQCPPSPSYGTLLKPYKVHLKDHFLAHIKSEDSTSADHTRSLEVRYSRYSRTMYQAMTGRGNKKKVGDEVEKVIKVPMTSAFVTAEAKLDTGAKIAQKRRR